MGAVFITSFYLGKMLAGAVVGGIIPMIIAFTKRRWSLGVAALIFCGIAALVHSIASIVVGVIFIVVTVKAYPGYSSYKEPKSGSSVRATSNLNCTTVSMEEPKPKRASQMDPEEFQKLPAWKRVELLQEEEREQPTA